MFFLTILHTTHTREPRQSSSNVVVGTAARARGVPMPYNSPLHEFNAIIRTTARSHARRICARTTVRCVDVVPISTNPSRLVSPARADFVDFFAMGVGECRVECRDVAVR